MTAKAISIGLVILLVTLLTLVGCVEEKSHTAKVLPKPIVRVGLLPLGGFEDNLVGEISDAVTRAYGFEVVKLEEEAMPQSAFVHIKTPRYRADSILRFLRRNKPKEVNFVMGLTTFDISTTKRKPNEEIKEPVNKYRDWGIFGYGFQPGPSSVVSTFRLKTTDENLLIARLRKICLHELGHNLGLPHCQSGENCLMRDAAETIRTIDEVDEALCQSCSLLVSSQ